MRSILGGRLWLSFTVSCGRSCPPPLQPTISEPRTTAEVIIVEKVRFIMGLVPRGSVTPMPLQAGGRIIALGGVLDLSGKILDLVVLGEKRVERLDEQLLG